MSEITHYTANDGYMAIKIDSATINFDSASTANKKAEEEKLKAELRKATAETETHELKMRFPEPKSC